jgi:hypothetical protein
MSWFNVQGDNWLSGNSSGGGGHGSNQGRSPKGRKRLIGAGVAVAGIGGLGYMYADAFVAGGLTVLGAGAASLSGWIALNKYHARKSADERGMQYVRIVPHAYTRTNPEVVQTLLTELWKEKRGKFNSLLHGKAWFQLIYSCEKGDHELGDIGIYLGYMGNFKAYVHQAIYNAYPNAEIIELEAEQVPVPEVTDGGFLRYESRQNKGFPFKTFNGSEKLTNILAHLRPGTAIAMVFRPQPQKAMQKIIQSQEKRIKGTSFKDWLLMREPKVLTKIDEDQIRALDDRRRAAYTPFEVQIQVTGSAYINVSKAIQTAMDSDNRLKFAEKKAPVKLSPYPWFFPRLLMLGSDEFGQLSYIPSGKTPEQLAKDIPHIYDRIVHLLPGQRGLKKDELTEGVAVGTLVHPVQKDREVAILEKKLRNMMAVVGTIGSGKTSLVYTMLRRELFPRFFSGKSFGGFTFVDPKGEAALTLLTDLRKGKIDGHAYDMDKVHYFDLNSSEYSIGLNILERHEGEPIEITLREALEVLGNAYRESSWFKKYGRKIIKALLMDKKEAHTILAISEFCSEESALRDRIKRQLAASKDTEDKEFLMEIKVMEERGEFGSSKMDPLLDRLSQIKDNPVTKRMFGQRKTSLDVLKYMEEGHVVLFNCEGLEQDEMKLVMGYITSLYHKAAAKRTNKDQNHYLIIDEAHNVQLDILHREILPKDRSKGLALILLSQYFEQFNEKLKMAITEISGNIVSFRAGKKTAREVQEMTAETIQQHDILRLKNMNAFVYTDNDAGKRIAFQIEADPPVIYDREGKPTHYSDDERRTGEEKETAWREALEEIGYSLMQRDCMTAEEAQKHINENLESLWGDGDEAPEELAGLLKHASDAGAKKRTLKIKKK